MRKRMEISDISSSTNNAIVSNWLQTRLHAEPSHTAIRPYPRNKQKKGESLLYRKYLQPKQHHR
jgi:hypothetical protein